MANGRIHSPAAFDASPSYRTYSNGRQKFIWDFLKQAFDWGIAPTDIDGLVERRGHYLLFECKNNGAQIPNGQERLLCDLNENHGFTVFVITGFDARSIKHLTIRWPRKFRTDEHENVTPKFVMKKCRQWFDWVEGLPRPKPTKLSPQEQTIEQWLADYEAYVR